MKDCNTGLGSLVSVVVPVFQCHESVGRLVSRFESISVALGCRIEIVLVDDGAPDSDWSAIADLSSPMEIRAIRLSRNFGQQVAIRTGLLNARGDVIVVIDCDLQDPPELIPLLVKPILEEDIDIVYSKRNGVYDESSRQLSRKFYSHTLRLVTGINTPEGMGPVALSRRATDYVLRFNEDAHLFHLLNWLGLPSEIVPYTRERRAHGKSAYTFRKKLQHAIRGLAFSSTRVFAFALIASLLIGAMALTVTAIVVLRSLTGNPPSGWLTLTILTALGFSGMGMLSSMIGGLLIEVLSLSRSRPQVIVRDQIELPRTESGDQA